MRLHSSIRPANRRAPIRCRWRRFGEDGVAYIRHLDYNAVFAYPAQAIQELHKVVNQQQLLIEELKHRLS